MKKFTQIAFTAMALLAVAFSTKAQNVGIGTATPNVSARLDISATNKGLLIPQVSLVSLTDVATIPTPATGLLVYNTNTALGTGFYYNAGTPAAASWLKLQTGSGGGSGWALTGNTGTDSTINFLGTTNAKPLMFRVNNGYAGLIGSQGAIAFGRGANGKLRHTAPSIIAIGDSALFNNADSFEIAIGNHALFNNNDVLPSENIAIGDFSLFTNTTGFENVSVGRLSLATNDTGFLNTAIGYSALLANESSLNTAVGAFALEFDSSGTRNTAVGFSALGNNIVGDLNTAVGLQALVSNVSGSANTSMGVNSLVNNDGDINTAMGWQSLFSNTDGSGNSAFGMNSLALNTTGVSNVAIGRSALFSSATGNGNTAVGQKALATLTSGNFNTAIGDSADVFATGTGLNNTTTLGFGALVVANNTISIGNTAITAIRGQVGFSTFSDGRYKKDVQEDVKGLDFIMQLRPVTYHYDFNKIRSERYNNLPANTDDLKASALPFSAGLKGNKMGGGFKRPSSIGTIGNIRLKPGINDTSLAAYYEEVKKNDGIRYTGFIAQEVEATAKKTGFDFSGVDKPQNANDHYALRYAEFVVPLVKAVQEQQAIIDAQNKKIEDLTKRLEKLENK